MAASNDLAPGAGTAPVTCATCGELSRPPARFCWWCGTAVGPGLPASETRKTVSIVFCDLVGSTALAEQLEAEAVRTAVTAYFAAMRTALEHHGGTIEKFIGDAVMAVFGVPELHEDDALRAVRAAQDMRTALEAVNRELRARCDVELRVRVGVNTGEVVAGDARAGQAFVTGDAVNIAARLEQAAGADEILISESTYRLVRDAVRVEQVPALRLKGKASPVPAFRLGAVLPNLPALARRLDAAFVGRAHERAQLSRTFRAVAEDGSARLVLIIGQPGAGKTRLAEEFAAEVADEALIVRARCLSYGAGLTFWTLGELIADVLGLPELESREAVRARLSEFLPADEQREVMVERVEQLLGLERTSSDLEQAFFVMRRLLEVAAADRPVVVLLEDVQWARPPLLDLVEYLVAATRTAPVHVLALARPELLEQRSSWRTDGEHRTVLDLGALADDDLRDLTRSLLAGAEVEEDLLGDVVAHATGNPLFLEELLRMLVDEGRLVQVDGRWTRAPGTTPLSVPPTVEPLVAARVERLDPAERRVLELASVVGTSFWAGAVHRLLGADRDGIDVDAALDALRRKGLVQPGDARFAGEQALSFTTAVMRDVAYRRLLKRDRAAFHEALAGWVTERVGERASEYDELLGYHLEQAVGYRSELGPLDDDGQALAIAASRRLASAGRRGLARGDVSAAADLLERSLALLPPEHDDRPAVSLRLGIALAETGELRRAEDLLRERVESDRSGLPFLMYRDSHGRHHVLDLDPAQDQLSVGRRPDNDVALAWDEQVSRDHAELTRRPDGWVLVDLESRNGSFVNGERAEGEQRLQDGDVLRLGDTILVFRDAVGGARPSRVNDAHSGITVLGRQFVA